MRRVHLVVPPAALLALIVAAAPLAAKPRPARCPDGRFLVQDKRLIQGAGTPTLEAVTLFGTTTSITTGCPGVAPKVTLSRKGTVLKATWPACPGLAGKVKLKATIAASDCVTMTGTLTATKARPKKQTFSAKRSVCGDHVLDPDANGEQCDGAGTCAVVTDTCTSACRCEPVASTTTSTNPVPPPTTTSTSLPPATTTTSPVPTTTIVTTSTTTTSTSSTTSTTINNDIRAVLELNEIEPNLVSGHDLVELRVVSAGTCDGITVEQAGASTLIILATLPAVAVEAGDVIVVHLNPVAGSGDGPASETVAKGQYPTAQYPSNYDGAWDFLGTPSQVSFASRVLQVRVPDANVPGGTVIDAVPFVKLPYGPPSGFVAAVQAIQGFGLWLPADCGGSPCTDASTPAVKDIAVDWTAASDTVPTGNSVARHAGAETHQLSDWATGPSTMGAPNP